MTKVKTKTEPSRLDKFLSVWGRSIDEANKLIFRPKKIADDREGDLIVMVVVSALRADPRLERAARAAASRGYRVVVIAPDISMPSHAEQPLDWGPNVSFDLTPYGSCSYVMNPPYVWNDVLFEKVSEYKPALMHANDLFTTVICMRAAQENGVPVVVDFHEWHAENVQWNAEKQAWGPHPKIERIMFRFFERIAMWRSDTIITVCESIANEMERMSLRPKGHMKIIRNIPPLDGLSSQKYPPLKEQLGVSEDTFIVMYQGGIGATRALEPIIEGLKYAPDVTFVIRGPGMDQIGPGYRQVAEDAGVSDRLILADAVPSRDVVAAARGADVGLWNLPNISKNFYYALPNKIWEYLAADLPILVSNFPEARKVALGHQVGLTFEPDDPRTVGEAMQKMASDKAFYARCRANVPKALRSLDVAREWQRLIDYYDDIIAKYPAPGHPLNAEGRSELIDLTAIAAKPTAKKAAPKKAAANKPAAKKKPATAKPAAKKAPSKKAVAKSTTRNKLAAKTAKKPSPKAS